MNNAYEEMHKSLAAEVAAEGMVLLKNDGCLPLDKETKSIALYGIGARQTVKGGTGSGDVNTRSFVSVEEGLESLGFEIITKKLLDEYDTVLYKERDNYNKSIQALSEKGVMTALGSMLGKPFKAPDMAKIRFADCEKFKAEFAVYVLSRNSGEGADRKNEKGDYLLSDNEISDISLLSENYQKLVLLLNVGGVIDISPVYDKTDAVLLIGQAGIGAGSAAADILSGKTTPSGKLTATWAKKYEDYPCAEDFTKGDIWNTEYKEDIFIGYRCFDRNRIKPMFPFGFGLSYTNFVTEIKDIEQRDNTVTITLSVMNKGNRFSGKDTVQIYVRQPKGIKEKAKKILVAFAKTKILAPNESEILSLFFDINDLAVYDEELSAWHIEKGEYEVYLGNSSDNLTLVSRVNLDDKIIPLKKITETFDEEIETAIQNLSVENTVNLVVGNARTSLTDFSVIGNASKSIPGAAGETTDMLEKHGIGHITMADGPAGIRINPKVYKKDGLYINNPKEDPVLSLVLPEKAQNPSPTYILL